MKPLFVWAGGKTRLIKHYIDHFPNDVVTYCEPFFGGGAVFVHVVKTFNPRKMVINDINEDLIRIYRSIKSDLPEFTHRVDELESQYIPMTKDDRKKFYIDVRHAHAWDYEGWSAPYEAATLYFLMKTGFNGIYQLNKNTNGRYGTPSGLLNQKDKVYDRDVINWWHNALQRTEILSGDWKDAVVGLPDDTFYYFDPPYRESIADYGNGFSDESLIELIDFCDDRTNVMLANRDDGDWWKDKRRSLSHINIPVTYTAGRRKKTEEGYEAKPAKEILLYKVDSGPFSVV